MKIFIRFALTVLALGALSASAATTNPDMGHVISLAGNQAWLVRGMNRTQLNVGTEFHAGDILVTGARTSVKLLMGQGEVAMLLNPYSNLWIEKTQRRDYEVSVKTGGLLSTVREPGKQATHYLIKTSTATMGVRGTTLFVRETAGKPTFFCPCHGKIAVDSATGTGEVDFASQHHDNPKLISAGTQPFAQRMRALPKNFDAGHSDAQIDDLKKLLKAD